MKYLNYTTLCCLTEVALCCCEIAYSALCTVLTGMFSVYQPFYRKGLSSLSIVRKCLFFVGSFHVASSLTCDKLESLVIVCSLSLCF